MKMTYIRGRLVDDDACLSEEVGIMNSAKVMKVAYIAEGSGHYDACVSEQVRVTRRANTLPLRRHMHGRLFIGLVLGIVALAACTSSKASPPLTTLPPSTIAVATTAVPATTSTAAATTTVAPTAPVTTVAVATTLDTASATEQVVRTAIDKARADGNACMAALPRCDVATLANSLGGVSLETFTKAVLQYNAAGQISRNRERNHYNIEDIKILGPDRAAAVVCNTDGSERVLPGAGPNGEDVIVDGFFVSRRDKYDMRLDADGTWRLYDGQLIGNPSPVDLCPVA
jgi:hypothetical protein